MWAWKRRNKVELLIKQSWLPQRKAIWVYIMKVDIRDLQSKNSFESNASINYSIIFFFHLQKNEIGNLLIRSRCCSRCITSPRRSCLHKWSHPSSTNITFDPTKCTNSKRTFATNHFAWTILKLNFQILSSLNSGSRRYWISCLWINSRKPTSGSRPNLKLRIPIRGCQQFTKTSWYHWTELNFADTKCDKKAVN